MMAYIQKQIVELISEMFGAPRSYGHGVENIPYCCPKCDRGGHKYNLEVNVSKGVFHCWSCGYKGRLIRLFKDFGRGRQLAIVSSLPVYDKYTSDLSLSPTPGPKLTETERLSLGSHRSMTVEWDDSIHYRAAKRYLADRGIDDHIIKKWDISYSEKGPNKFRVIVPSRSSEGKLEYYVSRAFYDYVKPKYRNPQIPKQDIIFGEAFIDWSRPVTLVEGVFDAIIALNAVPILGTEIKSHKKLLGKIRANHTPVVVCLDAEAWVKAKEAYKVLDDIGVDVKIARVPDHYNDLSSAYELGGKRAVLDVLDSAHKMSWEESLW